MPDEEEFSWCPVCGELIDHCLGHGQIGDPVGAAKLSAHDEGYHGRCHPNGCDERRLMLQDGPRWWEDVIDPSPTREGD